MVLNATAGRSKRAYAAVGAAVLVVAAVLIVGRQHSGNSTPQGYTRMGQLGASELYAKVVDDHRRLAVVLRDPRGNDLCNGQGPLGGDHPPALCDGNVGSSFAYVAQVAKGSQPKELCNAYTGEPMTAHLLVSPADWSVDFVGVTGPGDSTVEPCRR